MVNKLKITSLKLKPSMVKACMSRKKTQTRRPYKEDRGLTVPDLVWVKEFDGMGRKTSNLTLEITGHKFERLHDISEDDAWQEGVCHEVEETDNVRWGNMAEADRQCITRQRFGNAKTAFHFLWTGCYPGRYHWETNPKVLVLTFKTLLINIDDYLAKEAA